jgi:hypothetical protein
MPRVRGISGLERPAIQWLFVAAGVALLAVAVATGVALVRARRATVLAAEQSQQLQRDRDQLDAALSHERATREALALELGRERRGASSPAPAAPPTLTLEPVRTKSPSGPAVAVPQPSVPLVEVRLQLPRGAASTQASYDVSLRSWVTGDVLLTRHRLLPVTSDHIQAVALRVPSDVFVPGQYELILTLTGSTAQDVATYEVAIVARTES